MGTFSVQSKSRELPQVFLRNMHDNRGGANPLSQVLKMGSFFCIIKQSYGAHDERGRLIWLNAVT